MSSQAHLFSFFFPGLSQIRTNRQIRVDNPDIVYRLFGIVRKRAGDQIVLFDNQHNALARLDECGKKNALISLEKLMPNQPINPRIMVCVGLTKKAYFEEVVYVCSALGVQTILPILTDQVERNWFSEKDASRLERISITAREQAKSFCPTQILPPVKLSDLGRELSAHNFDGPKILFHKGQEPFWQLAQNLKTKNPDNVTVVFGPEGGLVDTEREALIDNLGFQPHALCPTTLRTEDAVSVAVGALRSLL